MKTYTVRQIANLPSCDMPNYRQWLEVYDDGEQVGRWNFDYPYDDYVTGYLVIQEQDYEASGPIAAMFLFMNYLEGKETP